MRMMPSGSWMGIVAGKWSCPGVELAAPGTLAVALQIVDAAALLGVAAPHQTAIAAAAPALTETAGAAAQAMTGSGTVPAATAAALGIALSGTAAAV